MTFGAKPAKLLDREGLLTYALKILAMRALSIGELKQKLRSRAKADADIDEVLSVLKQAGALNDRKFADSFSTARKNNQGLGETRVLRDLLRRRVPSTVAKQAVSETYAGVNETELIEQFLERKYRGKDLGVFLQDQKNLASVYRRLRTSGFGASQSIRVLKRYAAAAEELPEEDAEPSNE